MQELASFSHNKLLKWFGIWNNIFLFFCKCWFSTKSWIFMHCALFRMSDFSVCVTSQRTYFSQLAPDQTWMIRFFPTAGGRVIQCLTIFLHLLSSWCSGRGLLRLDMAKSFWLPWALSHYSCIFIGFQRNLREL